METSQTETLNQKERIFERMRVEGGGYGSRETESINSRFIGEEVGPGQKKPSQKGRGS